jgi:citrate synthase
MTNDKPIRSNMGYSTADRVVVQGHDLVADLLGKLDLGSMAFLELTGRIPKTSEATMFNALLVTLVEHGMTPQAITSRLIYMSAPEALQAAVAAGLCGMGSMFGGGAEAAARMLQEGEQKSPANIVDEYRSAGSPVPGLGHPVHKPVDPRTVKLFELAKETGFDGKHVAKLQAISVDAMQRTDRILPINATGAIGAIMTEMGFDWRLCRAVSVIARAAGLVGHIAEELRNPIAPALWKRVDREVTQGAIDGPPDEQVLGSD